MYMYTLLTLVSNNSKITSKSLKIQHICTPRYNSLFIHIFSFKIIQSPHRYFSINVIQTLSVLFVMNEAIFLNWNMILFKNFRLQPRKERTHEIQKTVTLFIAVLTVKEIMQWKIKITKVKKELMGEQQVLKKYSHV